MIQPGESDTDNDLETNIETKKTDFCMETMTETWNEE